jgi:hypothetical protein
MLPPLKMVILAQLFLQAKMAKVLKLLQHKFIQEERKIRNRLIRIAIERDFLK